MEHLLHANICGTIKNFLVSQFMPLAESHMALSDSKLKLLNDLLWLMGNIFMEQNAPKYFSFIHENFHKALNILAKHLTMADETWLLVVWNMYALSFELKISKSKSDTLVFLEFLVFSKGRFLQMIGV